MVCRRAVVAIVIIAIFANFGGSVSAVQINESRGLDGYGWQQAYEISTPGASLRVTGSADRQFYDYGFKNITISGRLENYWATDCGWWYVSGSPTIGTFKIWDNSSVEVLTQSSAATTNGVASYTHAWSSTDKPGRWTVQVTEGTVVSQFYIYVRGQLDVTSVITSQSGSTLTVNAVVEDHAGTAIGGTHSTPPTVTAFISGPGYTNSTDLAWSSPYWTDDFELPSSGDYYITVSAGDDHTYWVDGRGSNRTSMAGSFPATFGGYGGTGPIVRAVIMALLALLLLRSGRKAASLCVLIFMGGRL